ncbi:CsbD family protein [Tateyamaria armeniaca]|uniref:CsbD family protein n=1 Tax=Tateyamaria armeniaca TaxID=2518930 RepID=A0ABW8UXI0_9RHOB
MNWDQIEGKWHQLKGSAQQKWGKLTDDDLDRAEGNREKLVGVIQEKYGKTKEEAREEVDSWMKSAA